MFEDSALLQLAAIVGLIVSCIIVIPAILLASAPEGGPDVDDK